MNKLRMTACLAALAVLALGACADGEDVATLGGQAKEPVSAEAEQAASADKFAACLQKSNIKATAEDNGDGQKWVNIESDEPMAFAAGDGSSSWAGGESTSDAEWEAAMAQLATLVTKYDPAQAEAMSGGTGDGATAISLSGAAAAVEEPDEELPRYLIIGDQDHTETLVKCLNESGYQPPVYQQDPAEELRQKEKTAKDTAEWAKCARENGYPGITDPDPPKADEWQTSPSVTLPGDITEDALRALITACPTFDPEAQKAFDDKLEALGNNPNSTEADWSKIWEESPSSPQIEFDIPGMNGEGAQPEEADWERINKLYEILWEQQNAYDEAQSFATAAPAAG